MASTDFHPESTGQSGLPYLIITAEHRPEQLVLALHGELDVSNGDCLWRAISVAAQDGPWQTLVLDLGALSFTDCSGLSVMVRAHRRLAGQGRRLVLTGARPMVRRLLGLTRLDTYLVLQAPEAAVSPRADRGDQPPYPVLPRPRCSPAC